MQNFLINNYQLKLTTNTLANKQIKIKFHKNILMVLFNPNNIDIQNLLIKNNITFRPFLYLS